MCSGFLPQSKKKKAGLDEWNLQIVPRWVPIVFKGKLMEHICKSGVKTNIFVRRLKASLLLGDRGRHDYNPLLDVGVFYHDLIFLCAPVWTPPVSC